MPKRPNIILIMTDQQRADTVAAHGASHMHTPHIDSLVDGGISFHQAHCPGATCTPSRAAIFTGMFAHNTGTYSFNNWGHQRTWVQDLADHGYYCANIGKMHFQPRDVTGGFHERIIVENPTSTGNWGGNGDDDWGKFLAFNDQERPNYRHLSDPDWQNKYQCVPWHLDEHLHSDVFTADSACSWIKQWKEEKPLFLQVGFPGPHEPWDAPQRWVDRYDPNNLPEPVDFDNDLSDLPAQQTAIKNFHATCDHESRIDMPNAKPEDVQRMRQHYYAKISYVDEQIGKVLDALDQSGLLENSIVLFTSDHGEMLGDHGMAYKWLMYDSITRVPFIIKDFRSKASSLSVDALTSLMDIGPTVLEYAQCPVATRLEGKSLKPILTGNSTENHNAVYCEDNYMVMRRTQTTKTVHYIGQNQGEFYDLVQDPTESKNLWNDPTYSELRDQERLKLLDWLATSSYFNGGHKTQSADSNNHYPIRWHSDGNYGIHGDNYRFIQR
ncbi:sulfatase-like hydrolase/transferase [Puniceicoccaceae bacterium K14]|nr:sulfatase-like hydrolase/transferase [Puniceicoccaceae bacterium K14]